MSLFVMKLSSGPILVLPSRRPCYESSYIKLLHFIGYNMAMMDKKTLSALQISGIVLQVITLILVLAIFYIMSARITAVEQKQAVLEHHMEVIRDAQINIQPLRNNPGQ
jgi:predicted tellurium resistance membrane protein TerC